MKHVRRIVFYKHYFEDFFIALPLKVQDKILGIFKIIEFTEKVPGEYLKSLKGTSGLYEIRVQFGSNIWRIFCIFDKGGIIVLLNGFQKKSAKTPREQLNRALKLKLEYEQNTST